jgi:hypothetical protein
MLGHSLERASEKSLLNSSSLVILGGCATLYLIPHYSVNRYQHQNNGRTRVSREPRVELDLRPTKLVIRLIR